MARKETSQSHNGAPTEGGASPFGAAFTGPWKDALEGQAERMSSFYETFDRSAAEGFQKLQTAVDEAARMTKESLRYAEELTTSWRRMALDSARRSTEWLTPRASG